jgi:hypothetical protein
MDYVEAGLLILLVAAGSVIAADLVRRALGGPRSARLRCRPAPTTA